jgi:hypothetical protein
MSKIQEMYQKLILIAGIQLVLCGESAAQPCSTTNNIPNDCSDGARIDFVEMNGVATLGNYGCSSGGYMFYGQLRTFTIGSPVTWSVNTGATFPQGMGVAIWIDLNNDNIYQNNEMVASSTPKYNHSGTFVIPSTTAPYTWGRMRVRACYNKYFTGSDHCSDMSQCFGETEDSWVSVVCGPNSGPALFVSPSATTICKGGSTKLIASGGTSYTWTPGNVTTSTISLAPLVTTIYTLSGKGTNCPSAVSKKTYTVGVSDPKITVVPASAIVCRGDRHMITASGASTYTWNGQATGAQFQANTDSTGTTIAGVTGKNIYGCTAAASATVTVEECTGLEETPGSPLELKAYPNPAEIGFSVIVSQDLELDIVNLYGQKLRVVSMKAREPLFISGLPPGVYLLRARSLRNVSSRILVTDGSF